MTIPDQNARIALRLKTLREESGLTQEAFASAIGIESRQSVAAIESGDRRISPEELVRAAEVLAVTPDALLDPFRLVGEGDFSFRAKDVPPAVLLAFEDQAGRWIATYRELATRLGESGRLLGMRLELSERSSYEDAAACGEALWREWGLGEVPADRLEEAIERYLGVLVLYVDAPEGISGAASHLPKFHSILVNRNEAPGRRSFDLAHELFHILTWEAMPPKRVEPQDVPKRKGNRTEYLADNFAAALLMPGELLARRWSERGDEDLGAWLGRVAAELRVSTVSLQWRLVNLNLASERELKSARVPARPSRAAEEEPPILFGRRFVTLVAKAVDEGRLSLRRAAGLLGLAVADLGELCVAYGCPLSYDLAE